MSRLDPRAAFAVLAAAVSVALLGGPLALAALTAIALASAVQGRSVRSLVRPVGSTLPVAIAIVLLDGLAGAPLRGVLSAVRLEVLVLVLAAFAASVDGDRLADGLIALRVPFAVTFVLITGARFVPVALSDVAELRDAARLRGLAFDGPPWRQLASWRVLLLPLFVTTVRRGLQLGEAMELRGFGLPGRTGPLVALRWSRRDGLVAAGAFVTALLGLALGLLGGPPGVTGPGG